MSATTRDPRPGELEGVDYRFVSDAEFDALIQAGGLLEWAPYGGYRYGTPRAAVIESLEEGRDILLDIENDGAGQVRRSYPEAVLIFVAPPSLGELERRLRNRGDTSEADIAARLAVAAAQIEQAPEIYDYIVVNEQLDDAITAMTSILRGPPPPGAVADAPAGRIPSEEPPGS